MTRSNKVKIGQRAAERYVHETVLRERNPFSNYLLFSQIRTFSCELSLALCHFETQCPVVSDFEKRIRLKGLQN